MTPTPLTENMRTVLELATKQTLTRVHNPQEPGKPPWPANPVTLHALVRHELVRLDERLSRQRYRIQEWTITERGREALKPQIRLAPDRPRYLCRPSRTTGDYTYDHTQSLDIDTPPENGTRMAVETVGPSVLAQFARDARDREKTAKLERERQKDNLQLYERLQRALEEAESKGIDTRHQQASIRQRIESLESKIRKLAA